MNLWLRLLLLTVRNRLHLRPSLSIWDTARTPFRVAPTDLDLLRHMNNGRYLTIMDLARMDLMLRSGVWSQLRERGWYPVIAGQTITFKRSLTLGQRFVVDSRILGLDERWIFLEQTFRRRGTVIARAVVRARFLRDQGGSVESSELAEILGSTPEDREVPAWVQEWSEATRISSSE